MIGCGNFDWECMMSYVVFGFGSFCLSIDYILGVALHCVDVVVVVLFGNFGCFCC